MSLPIPREAMQALELGLVDDVALDRVLEVVTPVQLDRAGNVALLVEVRVLVHLRDHDAVVVEALGQPVGRDEHLLAVTLGHGASRCLPDRRVELANGDGAFEPVTDLAVGADDEDPRLGGQLPLRHPLVHALGGIVVLVDLDVDEADARVGVVAAHRADDVHGRPAGAARAVLRRREGDDERRAVGQRVGDRAAVELPIRHLRRRQLVERRRGEGRRLRRGRRRRRCRARPSAS